MYQSIRWDALYKYKLFILKRIFFFRQQKVVLNQMSNPVVNMTLDAPKISCRIHTFPPSTVDDTQFITDHKSTCITDIMKIHTSLPNLSEECLHFGLALLDEGRDGVDVALELSGVVAFSS